MVNKILIYVCKKIGKKNNKELKIFIINYKVNNKSKMKIQI